MTLQLPADSRIMIEKKDGLHTITIPHKKPGKSRYFILAFLLFWLGGWFMGEIGALTMLLSGKAGKALPFMVFWLGGWTIGGIAASYTAYRLIQPAIPEQIIINKRSVFHNSGRAQLSGLESYSTGQNPWKGIFAKAVRTNWTRKDIKTLNLRETQDSNRLTIDIGSKRLELAPGVGEVEREWLYAFLQAELRY